ncbi:hypothetical protein OM076_41080 [Solirubrobacter ginsenosidimutans]|uniref:Uncharacterized protein n=1 Tax=Solirubrobacter ginsenosidimutans TaxID=490573 RepID=A0A9X3N424_9ACTN|nr:hypothetical protein [Solirubrobacter ginsenosidimutans]MDA0166728.1 hypothetical protein [Solirubrobacter ginsenosidimutans]
MDAYVDLRLAPYNVVANNPAKGSDNTAGINAAISACSGTRARLVLPQGAIYVDQADGTKNWSIKFGPGVSDLTLAGQGRFATRIIQQGVGDSGDWHALMLDGAARIELTDFGVSTGTITNPDPGDEVHLISVVSVSGTPTTDIFGHRLYFGQCIGDQLRFLGAGAPVTDCRFTGLLMHGAGIGRGARSGIALQRGFSRIEISDFYIDGSKNSPIDMEPTGTDPGTMEHLSIHHGVCDNSLGRTSVAFSIGGLSHGPRVAHMRVADVLVLAGRVNILSTDDLHVDRLTVLSSEAYPADVHGPTVAVRQINNDLVLSNLHLERTGTSAKGNVLDISNAGNSTFIDGGLFLAGVTGYPIYVADSRNLRVRSPRIRYEAASPAGKSALAVTALNRDADDVQIDGLEVVSTTGPLRAAIDLASRGAHSMANVRVGGVSCAGAAASGVYLSRGEGSRLDKTPLLTAIDNGSGRTWKQVDQNDTAITTLFPIISGNPGGICTFEGEAAPESAVSAIQGCTCIFRAGDSTGTYRKQTGTGDTGWSLVPAGT